MIVRNGMLSGIAAFFLLALAAGPAEAARVRFHYVAADGCGAFQPAGSAERLTWLGGWEPYNCPPAHPTCVVTFRHHCTGQMVAVPLALPEGTPTIEYRLRSVVYNYGSYTVEVHFLPDGGVNVIYNSGLFRAL